ncbi:uncharacterized protein LOC119403569 [Rhipicephalus sanguineus]|uniref:uncharacterized protein LOC119403569 n=1 Tax=Rhipicephalus sanguineus TaxID=34632 RepID=UPI00189358C5|nr:uncharacterized protein LOC119403569 [Rhipicephalus sanguineus]
MAAARIQRWALLLGAYKYRLQYKPGKQLVNADALSRLPQPLQHEVGAEEDSTECVLLLHQWDEPAIPVKELQASTAADVTLAAVYREPPASRTTVVDCEQWTIAPGDAVYVRNYGAGDKWTPGKVKSTEGSRVVSVETDKGIVHRHADQVRNERQTDHPLQCQTMTPRELVHSPVTELQPFSQHRRTSQQMFQPQLRRSTRERKPVERYGF